MIKMKHYLFFVTAIIVISFKSVANIRNPHEGGICHVEAEYFYPGAREKHGDNELICNYWKFLDEDSQKELESQLNEEEYSDSGDNYGDYDSYNETSLNN
jgi:hypothetical protein